MKEIIRAKDEHLSNSFAQVFLEQPRRGAYFVNEQPISQVWIADDASTAGMSREETGVERVHRQIDGLDRYWDVYVPSCYRPDDGATYPLVLAIHGYSCNSEYFAQTSD